MDFLDSVCLLMNDTNFLVSIYIYLLVSNVVFSHNILFLGRE